MDIGLCNCYELQIDTLLAGFVIGLDISKPKGNGVFPNIARQCCGCIRSFHNAQMQTILLKRKKELERFFMVDSNF